MATGPGLSEVGARVEMSGPGYQLQIHVTERPVQSQVEGQIPRGRLRMKLRSFKAWDKLQRAEDRVTLLLGRATVCRL